MILLSAKLSEVEILKLSNEWQTDDDVERHRHTFLIIMRGKKPAHKNQQQSTSCLSLSLSLLPIRHAFDTKYINTRALCACVHLWKMNPRDAR